MIINSLDADDHITSSWSVCAVSKCDWKQQHVEASFFQSATRRTCSSKTTSASNFPPSHCFLFLTPSASSSPSIFLFFCLFLRFVPSFSLSLLQNHVRLRYVYALFSKLFPCTRAATNVRTIRILFVWDFHERTFLRIVRGPRAQNEKFRSNSLPTLVWEHESPLQPMNNRKVKSIYQRKCPKLSFSETDRFPSRCHGNGTWLHVFLFFYAVHCNFFSIFLFFSPTGLHSPSELLRNSEFESFILKCHRSETTVLHIVYCTCT